MSELRKTYDGGLFFMTLAVVGWLDVFTRPLYVNEIIKSLQFCQEKKGLEIYAYVIMTNHIHLVAARTEGEMSDVLRDFPVWSKCSIALVQVCNLDSPALLMNSWSKNKKSIREMNEKNQ
jgi:hypothetical protein